MQGNDSFKNIFVFQLLFVKIVIGLQGDEGLVHFQWLDRTQNSVEDVSFFPFATIDTRRGRNNCRDTISYFVI